MVIHGYWGLKPMVTGKSHGFKPGKSHGSPWSIALNPSRPGSQGTAPTPAEPSGRLRRHVQLVDPVCELLICDEGHRLRPWAWQSWGEPR